MSDIADTVDENDEDLAAEGQDQQPNHMIPKHRYDSMAEQNRFLKEQIELQKQAMAMQQQHMRPQQQPEPEEELEGWDPSVVAGVKKLIGKAVEAERNHFGQIIGHMANQSEEQQFIIEQGPDAKKYLPKIRELRRSYAQRRMPLDVETAFKMVKFDELEKRAKAPAQKAKNQPVVQEEEADDQAPPPAQRRTAKAFNEMSVEEMEAEIDANPGAIRLR